MRTILPKQSQYDWSALQSTVAGIHAEVRKGIEKRRDGDRVRVILHNLGFMLWLYLKIAIGFWLAGMMYVALS